MSTTQSNHRAELAIACALWVLGFLVASSYMRTFNRIGGVADFGQPEFGAAVALACGKGFVNTGYDATPGLAAFLSRQRDAFSCSELPAGIGGELNITQRLYRYLMSSAGLIWAIRGVSWSGLWPLFGAMFGSVIALAYGLFRIAIGRILSVAASLALVVSAIHFGHLPYLRDYAKAPFMLALVLLMAHMARGPVTVRRMVAYGAAFGLVLGIGFGFRNDLLIHVPPFLAVVLLCVRGRISANLRAKSAAVGAALVVFVIAGWPILKAYSGGSNTGHVAVLGLTTPYDRTLGIRGSLYDWGYAYNDQFAANLITNYSYRVDGHHVEYLSKDYDRKAVEYLLQIVRHWPADILTRVYGSVVNILQMPFTVGTWASSIPYGMTTRWVTEVYGWQIWLLPRYLEGCGVIVTAAALTIISVRSAWIAAALLLFVIYYAGYPAIQFGARHFFHLEFIGWWALAFVLQQLVSLALPIVRGGNESLRAAIRPAAWRRPATRAAIFATAAIAILIGSLTTLRAYQTPRVRSLLRDYLAAPRERLQTMLTTEGSKVLVVSPGLWEPTEGESSGASIRARYLIAEFASSLACDAVQLPVTFRYWYETKTSDFSKEALVRLTADGQPTRLFFPAFYDRSWSSAEGPSGSYFEGVELPREYAGCLAALYRITDLERYPMLLDITFTPGWENADAYQTLAGIEQVKRSDGPALYAQPRNLVVTRAMVESSLESISDDVMDRAGIATRSGGGAWVFHGRPQGPQSSLLQFKSRPVPRHAVLVAEGEVHTGGVSFGLLPADARNVAVSVSQPGSFVVTLEAPSDGDFGVAIANDIVPWWPASQIGHRVGPLVEWIPRATLRTDLVVKRIGWWTPSREETRAGRDKD